MKRILIVEDDTTFGLMLSTWLKKKGFETECAGTVREGCRKLEEGRWDLLLTDMRLPDRDGVSLLQWQQERRTAVPTIVMTGYAEIGNAVLSMKLGAKDYISKPVNPEELLRKIGEVLAAAEKGAAEAPPAAGAEEVLPGPDYIEGRGVAARKLYEYVDIVAPTPLSVLITGESGTGKEHVARLIHEKSRRRGKPFLAIDCGAIPNDLAASEFFGHVKGSFTGALKDKRGAFEEAAGGTIFLDEVGNLPYQTQVQLLRALQERKIRPVGGAHEIPVDVRVVAATNERLEEAIARGTFRLDLYHRLNEFSIHLPALREQPDDIMLYADFFLDQADRELEKEVVGFDAGAAACLRRYDWPGNLRQLKNTVTCAVLLARGEYVTEEELPAELREASSRPAALRDPRQERERIVQALQATGGNRSQAAKLLGVDRKTLYNKMQLYGIEM